MAQKCALCQQDIGGFGGEKCVSLACIRQLTESIYVNLGVIDIAIGLAPSQRSATGISKTRPAPFPD